MYKMKTVPWEHQLKALDYLIVRNYGALYTDMGSGKTKVGIDLIVNRGFNLTVIVGTKKSCDVWEHEFQIHMNEPKICVFKLSNLSTADKVSKIKETFARAKENNQKLVFIINYDSVWRKPFSEKFIKMPIDCIICDESHRIKAPGSKCSLYLTRIGKKVPNRYLFTGTPSTNSPVDVYAQYRFLQPEIFGTQFNKFRDRYENLDVQKTMYVGYRVLNQKNPYKNLDELKEKMYSCAFHITPDLHLPETTDINLEFKISKQMENTYKELVKEGVYVDKDGVLETNNSLAKNLRLQELLSGYVPMEDEDFTKHFKKTVDSSRIDTFSDLLDGISNTEKVVVFCKFRYDFDRIQEVCRKLGRSYGEISGQRDDYEKWNQGQIDVVAVHYQSGAESINLTQARYCIYYSLSHSYGLYAQSRKRVHRPGQKRPVTYYTLIAKATGIQTVDEKIVKALSLKKNLSDYLLGED